jgi:phosphatidylinositol-4,5-bisphosphate 3-kinase
LDYASATGPFRAELALIILPKEFHLPMDPRLIVDSFIIDKCKVMNSKKKPFWLTFRNALIFATEPVQTMFKVGDDLRQDQRTLQVMKVMESLWRKNGENLHMRCYGVLPIGIEQGFIEVIPNAITESELQKDRGTFTGVWAIDLFREIDVTLSMREK